MESPKFMVVPASFAAECPYAEEGYVRGWNSEREVYESLVKALKELHEANPECTLALFHGLRFAAKRQNYQQQGVSSTITDQEIDMVLLAVDSTRCE